MELNLKTILERKKYNDRIAPTGAKTASQLKGKFVLFLLLMA
jgi:hypothetical protein